MKITNTLFKCDNCGKEEKGYFNKVNWLKPPQWYEYENEYGIINLACSRKCIKTWFHRKVSNDTEGWSST